MQRRTLLLLSILGLILVHGLRHHTATTVKEISWYYEQPLIDLHIPDQVTSHTSPLHVQIAGSGVSIVPPTGYEELVAMNGYGDADTAIDVVEYRGRSFDSKRAEIDRYIAYTSHDRGEAEELTYRKDFRFNGYPASVICLSDTTRTHTAIYMIFGDEHFCVAMTGTTHSDSVKGREAIIQTMLTATYRRA